MTKATDARAGLKRTILGGVSATLAMSLGCQFARLRSDLPILNTVCHVPVHLAPPPGSSGALVAVLLTAGEMGMTVTSYGVATSGGDLTLPAPPGEQFLVGFQDTNGNFKFDSGEPAGRHGAPTLLKLKPGTVHQRLGLNLTVEGGLAENWPSNFLLQAEAAEVDPTVAVMAERVTLSDPRFDAEVANQGLWQPAAFLLRGQCAGMYLDSDYDAERPAVVLVHGIDGSPRIFAEVAARLRAEGLQPWFFYYPSGLPLDSSAAFLARSIRELRARFNPKSLSVVAHSMGGLVAGAALLKLAAEGDSALCERFVTLSTPFEGVESAELGIKFSPYIIPCWRQLAPGSDFLARLGSPAMPSPTPHSLVASFLRGEKGGDGVVTLASQTPATIQQRAARVVLVEASHVGVLRNDFALRCLVAVLKE